MGYVAGFCVLLIVSVLTGIVKSRIAPNAKSGFLGISLNSPSIGSLSRTDTNLLLARLEKTEPPESIMGAMCYSPRMEPASAEYICPVCGEKTLYDYSYSAFIDWELSGCRRLADSINMNTDFEVSLDETSFCDFCSPDSDDDSRTILLRVVYDSGDEIVNSVSMNDLRMLDSFLQGNLFYLTSNDGQYPLKDHADRLRTLLGFELEL